MDEIVLNDHHIADIFNGNYEHISEFSHDELLLLASFDNESEFIDLNILSSLYGSCCDSSAIITSLHDFINRRLFDACTISDTCPLYDLRTLFNAFNMCFDKYCIDIIDKFKFTVSDKLGCDVSSIKFISHNYIDNQLFFIINDLHVIHQWHNYNYFDIDKYEFFNELSGMRFYSNHYYFVPSQFSWFDVKCEYGGIIDVDRIYDILDYDEHTLIIEIPPHHADKFRKLYNVGNLNLINKLSISLGLNRNEIFRHY